VNSPGLPSARVGMVVVQAPEEGLTTKTKLPFRPEAEIATLARTTALDAKLDQRAARHKVPNT
jgi:hypothetical protein